jgi:hypothetical protein
VGKVTRLIIAILLLPVPFLFLEEGDDGDAAVAVAGTGIVSVESWTLAVPWGSEWGTGTSSPVPSTRQNLGFGNSTSDCKRGNGGRSTSNFYESVLRVWRRRCAFCVEKSLLALTGPGAGEENSCTVLLANSRRLLGTSHRHILRWENCSQRGDCEYVIFGTLCTGRGLFHRRRTKRKRYMRDTAPTSWSC